MLQNALNDSSQVFLLGEPELMDGEAPGFAARYNAMHRRWNNQSTKSTFCPQLTDMDGSWRAHWEALSRHYAWVGAKLVLNPGGGADRLSSLFDLLCREFYDAHYVFTFRDPLAAVLSTRDLQLLTTGRTDGLRGDHAQQRRSGGALRTGLAQPSQRARRDPRGRDRRRVRPARRLARRPAGASGELLRSESGPHL